MNAYVSRAIAVMLAAGSVSMVSAQVARNSTPGQTVTDANTPTTAPDVNASAIRGDAAPKMNFVPGPIAAPAGDAGDDKQLVDTIVGALNADTSLQDSKVAVSSEKGTVTITGATQTRAQRDKIGEIAVAQAGEGKVVNAVRDSAS